MLVSGLVYSAGSGNKFQLQSEPVCFVLHKQPQTSPERVSAFFPDGKVPPSLPSRQRHIYKAKATKERAEVTLLS